MAVIGNIGVQVSAQVRNFVGPLLTAQLSAGAFSKVLGAVKKSAITAGAAVAAQGAAFTALAVRGFRQGAALSRLSDQLGIYTEDLSRMKFIAESSGSSMGQLSSGIQNMVRTLGDAAAGGGSDVFTKLGLDPAKLQTMRPDESFRKIAGAIRGVSNQREQMAAFFKVFGTGAGNLIEMARLSDEEMAKMGETATGLGVVVSEEMGERLEMGNNALKKLGILATRSGEMIASALAPALVVVTDYLVEFFATGSKGESFFESMADAAIKAVSTIIDWVNTVVATIRNMFLKLFEFLESIVGEDAFKWVAGFNANDFRDVIDEQQKIRQEKAIKFTAELETRIQQVKDKAATTAAADRAAKALPGEPAEVLAKETAKKSTPQNFQQFESSLVAISESSGRVQRVEDPEQLAELRRIRESLTDQSGGLG